MVEINRNSLVNNRNLKNKQSAAVLGGTLFCTLICVLFCLSSCTFNNAEKIEFTRAEEASRKNDHSSAFKHYKAVVEKHTKTPLAIQAAKEAARISRYHLKKHHDAASFYKHLILYSASTQDRVEAQRQLADLYFTEMSDYRQAIIEFSRLLDLTNLKDEEFNYRLSIARCYFYLSNFYQAKVETDTILSRGYNKEMLFDALLLKANIFLTEKKHDDAVETLREIMAKYPDRAKSGSIGLILAVTYEEQKSFAKAIETLESIRDTYPKKAFIEGRIKILKERQSHLPGARGWKK